MSVKKGTIKKEKTGPPAEMPASLFLKKEMVRAAEKAVVYDLVEEFRGSRKNRHFTLYLSLLLFSALLLGGTFGLTSYIEHRNKNIPIDISDFEDINMQELLNSLRNAGKLMADMRRNMDLLKGKMGLELQNARMKALMELELLKKQHALTDAERAAMTKKIFKEREKRITAINAEYEDRLKDKEKSIEEMKRKMGDHEARLQQKMNAYAANLEVKLKEYQGESAAGRAKAEELVKQMDEDHRLKREEEKKEFEKKIRDLTIKLKKTEEAAGASADKAGEYESLYALYRKALVHYAFARGEQGHVIHAGRDGSLLIELNPLVDLNKTGRGLVIDKNGSVIARIELTPKDGVIRGHVVKMLKNVPINPFDMIIVLKE